MQLKFFLLLFFLFVGNSYANVVYTSAIDIDHPISKKNPVKKNKKKLRKEARKKALQKKRFKKFIQNQVKEASVGSTILFIFMILLLLAPVAFIIIGGFFTGSIVWLVLGTILISLWLIVSYFLILSNSNASSFGLCFCLFFLLVCIGFLIWAAIAMLPTILILSIILGVFALLGFLLYILLNIG